MLPSSLQGQRARPANPPTGRLGIFHASLNRAARSLCASLVRSDRLGWSEVSPTCRLGDFTEALPCVVFAEHASVVT
jgi:hypothetical protein